MTSKQQVTNDSFKYQTKFGFTKNRDLNAINGYIKLINDSLNVNIGMHQTSWISSMTSLKNFLNEYDFAEHEGPKVNMKTIQQFISRLNPQYEVKNEDIKPIINNEDHELNNSENKNYNLNFLPINKLNVMNQQEINYGLGLNERAFPQFDVPINQRNTVRGRIGFGDNDDLFKFVSSKKHQDIVRRNNFMPGAFDLWNQNPKGGNNKYYGAEEDIDGDGIPEFVVRRGDAHGPRIAVNGYTTKLSDWPVRKEYYKAYPTRADRKGKNVNIFANEEYFNPIYAANQMDITGYNGIDPKSLHYQGKYNLHISSQRSPYRALQAIIVNPAVKEALNEVCNNDKEVIKQTRAQIKEGMGGGILETYVMSSVYDDLVKSRVLNSLTQTGALQSLKENFITNKTDKNPNYNVQNIDDPETKEYEEFVSSVMNRASVKKAVKEYVAGLLSDGETVAQLKNVCKETVIALIGKFIQLQPQQQQ